MGFGVRTSVSSAVKNVFTDNLSRKNFEILWNEMQMQGKKILVGNIYIPPGNENHLHIQDMELEKQKGENIPLIGDFSSRNKIWDKNANDNSRMDPNLKTLLTVMVSTSPQTRTSPKNNL